MQLECPERAASDLDDVALLQAFEKLFRMERQM
jgi:hypothetical protein